MARHVGELCANRTKFTLGSRHFSLAVPPQPSFVDIACGARRDVSLALRETQTSTEQLQQLSVLALETWPQAGFHWRVAHSFVPLPSASDVDFTHVVAPRRGEQNGRVVDGSPQSRARCIQALSALGGGPHTKPIIEQWLTVLVGNDLGRGLAFQLQCEDLSHFVRRLGNEENTLHDSVSNFVKHAVARLSAVGESFSTKELSELVGALARCQVQCPSLESKLHARMERKEILDDAGVIAAVAYVRTYRKLGILRETFLREALLKLKPRAAAQLLPHTFPENDLSVAHQFVFMMAIQGIIKGVEELRPRDVSALARGVLSWQGREFGIEQCSRLLQAVWPRLTAVLPYLGSQELVACLQAYWWQMLHNQVELSVTGMGDSTDHKAATEELKTKLLWPILSRLGEMRLRDIGKTLTTIAPPVHCEDVLDVDQRLAVSGYVAAAFPLGSLGETNTSAEGDWWDDFWSAEVEGLSTPELIDLVCGLGEADTRQPGQVWWTMDLLLEDLQRRLLATHGDARKSKVQPVELTHLMLVRMCRSMHLWQHHQVEVVLKHLLSHKDSLTPLPTPYYVEVLTELCKRAVPNDLTVRVLSDLLDTADHGRTVTADQWSDVLIATRDFECHERLSERVLQHLIPSFSQMPLDVLTKSLEGLAARPPRGQHTGGYCAIARAPLAVADAITRVATAPIEFPTLVRLFDSLSRLGWYTEKAIVPLLTQCMQTRLEIHTPQLLSLLRSCVSSRVHHAPLLHRVVTWYKWCCTYLKPHPLPQAELQELVDLSDLLCDLSFQSLELLESVTENLHNPNASSKQVLMMLTVLARQSHFPQEFREACKAVCAASNSDAGDLASLSPNELVKAFNVHLCAVFDGPAALKSFLMEDEMKDFFQVHTSQKWYQQQDRERTVFLQSEVYTALMRAVELEGLDLTLGDLGEAYHVELVSQTSNESAVVCVRSSEQLQWYVPIMADGAEGDPMRNRCLQFPFLFGSTVQKVRHLQARGFKVAIIWLSEWNLLGEEDQRRYLRDAVGVVHRPFSPTREDHFYR